MNKPTIIAITLLTAFIGYCGYRASLLSEQQIQQQIDGSPKYSPHMTYRVREPWPWPTPGTIQQEIDGAPRYSPNAMYRVRIPIPVPISPEDVNEQAIYFAAAQEAKLNEAMKINGHAIVAGLPIAVVDQQAMNRAMGRKLYNVHEYYRTSAPR